MHILVLGLGAGSLLQLVAERHPSASIVVVESEQLVVDLARGAFDLKLPKSVSIVLMDAAQYMDNCSVDANCKYDLVFMDVYDSFSIPAQFVTGQFTTAMRESLTETGAAIINCDDESIEFVHSLWSHVFAGVWQFHMKVDTENIVLLATVSSKPGLTPERWVAIAREEEESEWPHFPLQPLVAAARNCSSPPAIWLEIKDFSEVVAFMAAGKTETIVGGHQGGHWTVCTGVYCTHCTHCTHYTHCAHCTHCIHWTVCTDPPCFGEAATRNANEKRIQALQ
jgi:hypothetical protein